MSSTAKTFPEVDDGKTKVYLYLSAYVEFLDVISASIYGITTDDGFKFVETVQAGQKHDGGAWAGEEIWVQMDFKDVAFGAGFSFDFGLEDVQHRAVEGIRRGPDPEELHCPASRSSGVSVSGNLTKGQFGMSGDLKFDLFGLKWDPSFSLGLDLSQAPATLAAFGTSIFDWIDDNLEKLLEDALNTVDKFWNWVKQNFEIFKDKVVGVAKAMRDFFSAAGKDIARASEEHRLRRF